MGHTEVVFRLIAGLGVLAFAAYLGIARDKSEKRIQRVTFLFGIIFVIFAMLFGAYVIAMIAPHFLNLTAENFESSMLVLQIFVNIFIGIPGLTWMMRLISMRCRDAGYRPGLAYIGAIPVVQLLFILWLCFPKPVDPMTRSGTA
jgi:uncharacterized membrane protein YhaH (DUF805 family)